MPAGEGGDGLGGGVDVGGLGVVVELDAVDGGDEFEAMLDGLEVFNGGADGVGRGSGEAGGADRGEDIFHVVLALERDSGERHDFFGGRVLRGADRRRSHLRPMRPAATDARARTRRRGARSAAAACGGADVVGVEHDEVLRGLRGEDALLGEGVVFKGAVAVEVVGRDVEDDGDRWDETVRCVSSWKLETSRTDQVSGVLSSMRAMTGTPMLPPTSV